MSHYKSHSRSLRRSRSKSKSKMQKSRSRSRRQRNRNAVCHWCRLSCERGRYSPSRSSRLNPRSKGKQGRYSRKSQRGGSTILSPSNYSNQNNAHFSGIGFTDPTGALTGCTGSTSSAAALKGVDVFQTIGGITKPVPSMKGGRKRILNKDMKPLHKSMDKEMKKLHISMKNKSMRRGRGRGRMHRGGSIHNTNGFSIGGVHLKPSLSGIANNYHTAYDSCKG